MNKVYFFLLLLASNSLFSMEEVIHSLSFSTNDSVSTINTNAITDYSKQRLEILMENYPDNINCRDENGMTPLMYAVTFNDLELINKFVNEGADVTLATPHGITAFWIAYYLNYDVIADFLFENQ